MQHPASTEDAELYQQLNVPLGMTDIKTHALHTPPIQLCTIALNHEDRAAVNAAWALTHSKHIQQLTPYYQELTEKAMAMATKNPSLCRILTTILLRLPQPQEPNIHFLNFCLEHIPSSQTPQGIRCNATKLAYRMSQPYPELLAELKATLTLLPTAELNAGLKHTKSTVLALIEQHIHTH